MTHRPVSTPAFPTPAIARLLSSTPLLLAMAGPALADDPPDAAAMELAPVTVEARQWKEDVRRIPGSVEVLTPDALDSPLSGGLAAIAKRSPNVQIEQSSVQTRIVMRGMTSANTALQDPLGFFVNDVALPHGAAQAPRLPDPAMLEILKGPQGSLYGRNTEAGAVKAASADPTWTPSGWASLSTGFQDGPDGWRPAVTASGRLSGPLAGDTLAGSLAFRAEDAKGAGLNRYDGSRNGAETGRWTLSGGLEARPDDDTDIRLKSLVERAELGKARMRYLSGPYATGRFTTNYNTPSWDDSTSAVQSLRIDRRGDGFDLTGVTGWTHYTRDFQMDLDGTPLSTLPTLSSHRDDALSQEIRLTSADPQARLRWLAGVYAYREWTELDFRIGTPRVGRKTDIEQTGLAGFGQADVGLTDALRLGLGGRLEWIGQSGRQTVSSAAGRMSYQQDLRHTTLLPRVSLSYEAGPDTTLYASYARGYLPGGYNYGTATSRDTLTYAPEHSWTAEAGVKASFAGGRGAVQFSVFHTRTTDKQILDLVPGGTQKVSNAAEAENLGAELSLNGRLSERWTLFGSGGLQRAKATAYTVNVNRNGALLPTDLSGNRLPMAAHATYALGIRYDEGERGWFGQVGVNGSGPYYFDSENTLRQSAFVLTDAEIGYRFASVELSLWGSNLFDRNVYTRAVRAPLGVLAEDGAAREVGLRVKAAW
ncbi:TonB-dependent receptor (plasmid) [Azospirillum humicireducens]|uniref:TonB-dependent receptor n=1 Tax=Azospirillum humicireducens TaxID=1226968 RepID=A0A2R4VRV2_9PROT|nr:TonB-dependent receptor [Azospirillum humicireducens]AWB07183.1 TonB-dependent receptor [Azospirillum humicireducens]